MVANAYRFVMRGEEMIGFQDATVAQVIRAASGRRAGGVVLASFNAALLGDTVAHAVCDLLLGLMRWGIVAQALQRNTSLQFFTIIAWDIQRLLATRWRPRSP